MTTQKPAGAVAAAADTLADTAALIADAIADFDTVLERSIARARADENEKAIAGGESLRLRLAPFATAAVAVQRAADELRDLVPAIDAGPLGTITVELSAHAFADVLRRAFDELGVELSASFLDGSPMFEGEPAGVLSADVADVAGRLLEVAR